MKASNVSDLSTHNNIK